MSNATNVLSKKTLCEISFPLDLQFFASYYLARTPLSVRAANMEAVNAERRMHILAILSIFERLQVIVAGG